MSGRKQPVSLLVAGGVNTVHHGLIGGKYARAWLLLALGEVAEGEVRHRLWKARLAESPVHCGRKKQQVLQPAVADQYIRKGDNCPCLPLPGGP